MLEKQLSEISTIPAKLDRLIERMERSNSTLASQVNNTMSRTAKEFISFASHGDSPNFAMSQILPGWMKWTIVISVILIALACISNMVYNVWFIPDRDPVKETLGAIDKVDTGMAFLVDDFFV